MSPFIETANPEDLAIMSEAFDNHCLAYKITDEDAKSNVARLVLLLFNSGAKTVDDLNAELARLRVF